MMAAQSGMAQAVHAGGYDSDVENAASAQGGNSIETFLVEF